MNFAVNLLFLSTHIISINILHFKVPGPDPLDLNKCHSNSIDFGQLSRFSKYYLPSNFLASTCRHWEDGSPVLADVSTSLL